jgi:hypothetical protein
MLLRLQMCGSGSYLESEVDAMWGTHGCEYYDYVSSDVTVCVLVGRSLFQRTMLSSPSGHR